MDRRRYLHLAGLLTSGALAGCSVSSPDESGPSNSTTDAGRSNENDSANGTGKNAASGVYVQSFRERMYVVGMGGMGGSGGMSGSDDMDTSSNTSSMGGMNGTTSMPIAGEYQFALMYAAPHVFWTVTGDETERTPIEQGDSLHLMSVVWDPKTKTVLPDTGLSVEITRDGELVSEEVIYPMLSQRMGFHYGANFPLSGDGTYTAKLSVGGTSVRRTGAFEGRFSKPASVEIEFPFTEQTRKQVSSPEAPRAGEPGAVPPMKMTAIPSAFATTRAQLTGEFLGKGKSDDAVFLVSRLSAEQSPLGNGNPYLMASARTPYNRLLLPAMALSATLSRGGKTVFEGALKRTLDPDLGYHYGTAMAGTKSGDTLTLSVETPPQVARHEGYEEAFLDMPDMKLRL